MPSLLHIDSSPRTESVSSKLANAFVDRWKLRNPSGTVLHHNTSLEAVPYLDEKVIEAFFTPAAELTAEQRNTLARSDQHVDELLAADAVVIGAPMWNLSVPASLKAWIDMIVREGRTFAFTPRGVVPLVPPGKKIYVFTARGGAYPTNSPLRALDHQEPYLRAILGVIGLTEIEFIHAGHQSEGEIAAAEGIANAVGALEALAY
ncbi:MAG: NAD(P)H-dependent oxidoreductase [Terracidiphilus sp.]